MRILRNKAFVIALAGFVIALSVHLLNGKLSGLPAGIHETADDASYLRPVENWLANGTWKDNSTGASAYVQRPPLLGIIHGIFHAVFGSGAPVATMVFFILLHALALYRLPGILQGFTAERIAYRLAWIYALLPCFWGFLSYQITEALSPSLVLLLLGVLLSKQRFSVLWAIVLITCLWFLRPVLLLLFPLLLFFLWKRRRELFARASWWNAAVGGLALLLVFGWEYRKAGYLHAWGQLHPIYHDSNQSIFRPTHASMSDVFRVWETRPEVFHAIVASCWSQDSSRRSLPAIEDYVAERSIPLEAAELHRLLSDYAAINRTLLTKMDNGTLPSETPAEIVFRQRLDSLAQELRSENALQYHIKTPLHSASEQLRKSQLNLELFQVRYRGNWFVEALRYGCVAVLLLLFAGSVLGLLSKKTELRWIAAGILFYAFYLFYVQRMNEDRYLIPMLPLVFVGGCAMWYNGIRALFPMRNER